MRVDISDTAPTERTVDTAVETSGSLDFAHDNAGILTDVVAVDDVTGADWGRLLDIDTKGVWACMKAELSVVPAGEEVIVDTSAMRPKPVVCTVNSTDGERCSAKSIPSSRGPRCIET